MSVLKKCYFYDLGASVQYKYTCTINPHSEEPKQSWVGEWGWTEGKILFGKMNGQNDESEGKEILLLL